MKPGELFQCSESLAYLGQSGTCPGRMVKLLDPDRQWFICPHCGSSMGAKFQCDPMYGRLRPRKT